MPATTRRSFRAWVLGAILFLALVAMVITGFGTGGIGGMGALGGGPATGTLAEIGGREVTEQEISDLINRRFAQLRQEQPTLDMATFLASGAFDQAMTQLVVAAAIQVFGEEQGLAVSKQMVDREIVKIPAFHNIAGQFDEATFRRALQGQNVTEAQLRDDIAKSLMQRQLLGPIALGAKVPEGVAREYANLLLERRQGSIGVVPAELLAGGIAPTDAQVSAFYNQNRGRFTIPERRVIRYAVMGPEQLGAAGQATDQEIQAYYRQNAATYGPRETRNLQQVVLQDQATAQAFVQRVRGGTSFADAAAQAGFGASDIAFANQTREQFADAAAPEVADAAFQAQQGAVVGPIRSELGFHVVRVEAVNTVPGRPLEAVRDEIAAQISQRKTADQLSALVGRVEDQLADGASFEEVARAERLQVVTTPPVTATGQSPEQPNWAAPAELQPLLQSAFELDPDDPEPMVEQIEPNQRYALLGIERVVPAAPPPLGQIRDQVRAALIQQQALERARQIAQGIVDKINRGMPAAQAFAEAQPRMPAPEAVNYQRLEISRGGAQVPPPLLTLFSLPQGRGRILQAPNGAGWFVIHHAQRTPGNAASQPQLIATTRAEFSNSAPEEFAQQFARGIELGADVERNEDAIRQARQRLLGNATMN